MKTKQTNPTRIYRTVSVEERLPKKAGWYNTTNHGICQFNGDDFYETVTDWLEEVELPTMDEVKNCNHPEAYLQSFRNGASFILNHIKGK